MSTTILPESQETNQTIRAACLGLAVLATTLLPGAGLLERGDANSDGQVDISDAIALFEWLTENPDTAICLGATDANDDGEVDYRDAVFLLQYMFLSGEAPVPFHPGGSPGCYGNAGSFELKNLSAAAISPSSVLVAWETPLPADTRVRYGLEPGRLEAEASVDESVVYHQVILAGLQSDTTYYYAVTSEDASGSSVTSEEGRFHTLADLPPTVRLDHPRIFFTPDEIPAIRARTERGGSHEGLWELLAGWAVSECQDPVEKIAESPHFLEYIRAFAFTGLIGDVKPCRDKAIELLLYAIEQETDVDLRDWTEALAIVYDWLHDDLRGFERDQIRKVLWRLCQALDARVRDNEFVTGHSHGDNKVLLLGLLALAGEVDGVDDLLVRAADRFHYGFLATWRYFAGMEGGSVKGWWYSTYALPFDLQFLAAWRSATGQDLFPQERVWCENLLDWFLFGLRGDGTFLRQGDAYVLNGMEHQNRWFGRLLASQYGNRQGQWFADKAEDLAGIWAPRAVLDILWYDPSVSAEPPAGSGSRWFRNAGVVICRDSWDDDSIMASFRSAELYTLGHTHRDNCSFTLFYKHGLALDSGVYDAFSSDHHENYYSRTIAHNTITVFDPNERFEKFGDEFANDGGQRWLVPEQDAAAAWPATVEAAVNRSNGYRLGGVIAYESEPQYTYAVGNGGPSYSPAKLEKFHRHFLWLSRLEGWDHPVLVLYDDVVSTRASFKKKYILHTEQKPVVDGNLVVAENGAGALYQWTVAPLKTKVRVVGGRDNEFSVRGVNHPTVDGRNYKDEPGSYRVEISPREPSTVDRFLHVLFACDADGPPPGKPVGFTAGDLQGVLVADWAVLFSPGKPFVTAQYMSPRPESRHILCGAVPLAEYAVFLNEKFQTMVTASFAGVVRFQIESPGQVRLVAKP